MIVEKIVKCNIIFLKERNEKKMSRRDDDDTALIGLVIGLSIILFIVYVVVLVATVIVNVAVAVGTVYGAGSAIKNYISSFKENVIDSNRKAINPTA